MPIAEALRVLNYRTDINFYGNPMPEYYKVQKVSLSSASWQPRGAAGILLSHLNAAMILNDYFFSFFFFSFSLIITTTITIIIRLPTGSFSGEALLLSDGAGESSSAVEDEA